MDVDVVLFDLDGTLVDHELAVKQAVSTLVGLHPEVFGSRPLAWVRAVWRELQETWFSRYLHDDGVTFEEQRVQRVRGLWERAGAPVPERDAALAAFASYLRAYEDNWAVYDDVFPCLDRLAHLRLGVLTNGETDQQRSKLVRTGMAPRLEAMVTSADVGVPKPDARLFVAASERFGVAPERCVYVGDRLETDPVAAVAAGLQGVWLDRAGTGDGTRLPADVRRITTLAEL